MASDPPICPVCHTAGRATDYMRVSSPGGVDEQIPVGYACPNGHDPASSEWQAAAKFTILLDGEITLAVVWLAGIEALRSVIRRGMQMSAVGDLPLAAGGRVTVSWRAVRTAQVEQVSP